MTDTPDKEWIERATNAVAELHTIYATGRLPSDDAINFLARELQSSFDQGAERERERQAKPRMFPVMASRQSPPGPFSIPWSVAETAYGAYAKRYGRQQTMERMAERGGFYWAELDELHPKWRDEVSEIATLRAMVAPSPQPQPKESGKCIRALNTR